MAHVRHRAFQNSKLYRAVDDDSEWSTKFQKDCMLGIFYFTFLKGDRRLDLFCLTKLLTVWDKCHSKASLLRRIMGYSIIVLSGVCDVGSENHSKISGHMTSGEREFLIPVSAGF